MRKKLTTLVTYICLCTSLLFGLTDFVWASEYLTPENPSTKVSSDITDDSEITPDKIVPYRSQNEETGYYLYLEDWADLLTASEEEALTEVMKPITEHGNVAFVSIASNPNYSTENYAREYYQSRFGYSSGTVLIIDMDERYIWIHSDGEIYRTVTTAYANTITDNVYAYASREDYLGCASKAFEQINTLLDGRHIAQPMKYISNALLAIVLALLINYFLVMMLSRSRKASDSQLINGIFYKVDINNPRSEFIKQTKRYSPQSKSSSGGGGRSGGGGGGRSGGGGGHRF